MMIFLMSKIVRIFQKKNFIEEYQFSTPTFVKNIFYKSDLKNDLYLRSCTIFDEPSYNDGIKKKTLSSMLTLDQKSCFLESNIFEIPKPN